jgi:hypothetical protein
MVRRWTEQGSVENAIKELERRAANRGANGLLLISTVDTTTTVIGGLPVTGKTVQSSRQ